MSHYAKVLDGKVVQVIVAEEDFSLAALDAEAVQFAELPCFLQVLRAIAFVEPKNQRASRCFGAPVFQSHSIDKGKQRAVWDV